MTTQNASADTANITILRIQSGPWRDKTPRGEPIKYINLDSGLSRTLYDIKVVNDNDKIAGTAEKTYASYEGSIELLLKHSALQTLRPPKPFEQRDVEITIHHHVNKTDGVSANITIAVLDKVNDQITRRQIKRFALEGEQVFTITNGKRSLSSISMPDVSEHFKQAARNMESWNTYNHPVVIKAHAASLPQVY